MTLVASTERPVDPDLFLADSDSSPLRPGARLALRAAEFGTSIAVALVMVRLGGTVHVDPVLRVGQVSGLAALQLRLVLLLAAAVAVYAWAARHRPEPALRIACAAVAGLSTGLVAAGLVVALRGTTWPVDAQSGDSGVLLQWASDLGHGKRTYGAYPPMFIYLLHWFTDCFTHGDGGLALKDLEVFFTAITGPMAYLAWRSQLRPLWALGIGVTAAMTVVMPYKPYTTIGLCVLVPLLGKFVLVLASTPRLGAARTARRAAAFGAAFGALILFYSGWFIWSAAGLSLICAVVLVQIRRIGGRPALGRALLYLGVSGAVFATVASPYLRALLVGHDPVDRYLYSDALMDPTYFVSWTYGLGPAAKAGTPTGDLGGVGLFTVLLLAGLGIALALGIRNAGVLTTVAFVGSSFLMRYWLAEHMERDQAVNLWPRTSAELLYCFVALTGLAVMLATTRLRAWAAGLRPGGAPAGAGRRPGLPRTATAVGVLCALGLLFGMSGSMTADSYMPSAPPKGALGQLTWNSQTVRQSDGSCPAYAPGGHCRPFVPYRIPPYTPLPQKPVDLWAK